MKDINSFIAVFTTEAEYRSKSRIVLTQSLDYATLKNDYALKQFVYFIRVSKCIHQNNYLISPEKLWDLLDEKINEVNQSGKFACVVGLEAMFALWSHDCRMRCLGELRKRIDNGNSRILVFLESWDEERKNVFPHPKYYQNSIVTQLKNSENKKSTETRKILISNEFKQDPISGVHLSSIESYVREYENGTLQEGDVLIYADYNGIGFAGVDNSVEQIYTRQQFLNAFLDVNAAFSDGALDWLNDKIMPLAEIRPLLSVMQNYFFPNGIGETLLQEAPRKLYHQNDCGREILVWVLRETVAENSYLWHVLNNSNFSEQNFLECYILDALNLLRDANVVMLAEERRSGLERIGKDIVSGEIAKFINLAREQHIGHGLLMPWLNLQSLMEKAELVRFHVESEMINVNENILKSYPLLRDYLTPYDLGIKTLDDYFTEYRRSKVQNKTLEGFCRTAEQIQLPIQGVRRRDELLKDFSHDMSVGLLIVDALGAEYIPLILALAKKMSLGVSLCEVVEVRLPTSTEFNYVSEWISDQRCPEIKELDSIIHNGAEIHTKKSFEENFVAQLNVFETKIMPAIIQAIGHFDQVVLTADHGASRLAVCAYNQGLAKTLEVEDKTIVEDWRYARAIPNMPVPKGLTMNLSGSHWIVKGYNRLPKQGGKLYEMHGGLTYEECLVPFIVFKKGKSIVTNSKEISSILEFVENDDFDL